MKKSQASMSEAQLRPSDQKPSDPNMKLYSEIAAERDNNRKFKITIRSKEIHTPENMKELLKTRINPTEMEVGISSIKALKDGRILIEVGSKRKERE